MNQQQRKLKDNWFQVCSNPEDPDDEGLCIQIIDGPFSHVVVKFKNFQTYRKLNDDGSLDCDYQYDILHLFLNILFEKLNIPPIKAIIEPIQIQGVKGLK